MTDYAALAPRLVGRVVVLIPAFNEAESVEAIGRYERDRHVFRADSLLVKCPSKYNDKAEKKG